MRCGGAVQDRQAGNRPDATTPHPFGAFSNQSPPPYTSPHEPASVHESTRVLVAVVVVVAAVAVAVVAVVLRTHVHQVQTHA